MDMAPVLHSFRLAFIRCHPPVTLERMRNADTNFCGLVGAPAHLRGLWPAAAERVPARLPDASVLFFFLNADGFKETFL